MSDLIDRVALLDAMPKNDILLSFDVRRIIVEQTTVDAEPVRHGRWVRANDEQAYFDVEYLCSGCQFAVAVSGIGTPILHGYRYCPNCGAEMYAKEAEHGQES